MTRAEIQAAAIIVGERVGYDHPLAIALWNEYMDMYRKHQREQEESNAEHPS